MTQDDQDYFLININKYLNKAVSWLLIFNLTTC